ncbi:MAG: hypothetical protein U0I27_06310, partial [Christensenellales bacterium]|nr:hypothetical protein [Christensenellales bacterium]
TIPRTGKIASALLHAVCTCDFIPCSQSNEGCVTRFISRANNALELRFFSKFWVGGDDVDGLGAIMRGILRRAGKGEPLYCQQNVQRRKYNDRHVGENLQSTKLHSG